MLTVSRDCVHDLYRQLHQAGVIHGDVVPRHWLRGEDGKLRLIDFDGATFVGDNQNAKEMEMDLVETATFELFHFTHA